MAADVLVSLGLVAGIVALSHVTRNVASKALARTGLSSYAVELVSTFQLCCCAHELKLLSEVGGIAPGLALTLTYLVTVVHGLTLSGAVGNPSGTLENAYHRRISRACALRQIACQFAAAAAARAAAPQLWGLGLSGLHVRHKLLGFRCASPIHAPLPHAVAVEFLCAFAVQMVITHLSLLKEKYRVHAVAAVITAVVYAGGEVTGAVCNPALAFSIQFPCGGNTFLEYSLVYWISPLIGMMASVLMCDQIIPAMTRKPPQLHPSMKKKKMT
ncbi:aquaporin-11 [Takifugu rubripes]|uniref:Aquaporin n=2 Tax=Takifugu rubripes TaxID=31033 RepID=H2SZ41_TAKRU|nr:aquaporin-11 [Takifugu rubripes]BDT49282.1 aquaporin-11a [Takifugu rubripes]